MLTYRIIEIRPKSGALTEVHHSILNQRCQTLSLDLGKRGWLLVDIGDTEFGPHRIPVSHVISICNNRAGHEIMIETENSFYQLTKEKSQ